MWFTRWPRRATHIAPFEEIRNRVENDWQLFTSRKNDDDARVVMFENYIIDIQQPEEPAP